jgi:cytochrome-b5 reductase
LNFKRIFFIAGGSGITPIFQTILEIAHLQDDKTELILLFGNKTEEDIVLRKELEALSNRVRLLYILDTPPQGWPFYKGFVNHELLKEICPLDDPNTLYIHCGPAPMNKFLRELFAKEYPQSTLFKF